jgi:hypothetical protein
MTLEKLYYYISLGVAKNIIVFDVDAPSRITKRLLFLLCEHFRKTYSNSPTRLYLPEDEVIEVYDIIKNNDEEIELINITKVFGADVITSPYLNKNRECNKFYKDVCNGWLGANDTGIIIATDDNDHVVMGKY